MPIEAEQKQKKKEKEKTSGFSAGEEAVYDAVPKKKQITEVKTAVSKRPKTSPQAASRTVQSTGNGLADKSINSSKPKVKSYKEQVNDYVEKMANTWDGDDD